MTGQERAVAARAAAWLLRYPDEEVLAAVPLVCDAVADLPGPAGAGLRVAARHRRRTDPIALQREYVDLFDLRRRCCLYLTYYTAGDTRARGVALVEFGTAYRTAGMELSGGELPDFLPAVLELASVADAGWRLLGAHRVGLDLLTEALAAEAPVYREVAAAVRELLPPAGPAERRAARTLAEQGPPAEMVGLEGFAPAPPAGIGGRR
jgi:nitrate reductase delta subunit